MPLQRLCALGYGWLTDTIAGPNGSTPEFQAYSGMILSECLSKAVARRKPHIPEAARADAIRWVLAAERPACIDKNRCRHCFVVTGVPVEIWSVGARHGLKPGRHCFVVTGVPVEIWSVGARHGLKPGRHCFVVEGVPVEDGVEDGTTCGDAVRFIDPEDRLDDWRAFAQVTVTENRNRRRADGVVFLNSLPMAVIGVRKPGSETAMLAAAFSQLRTYKAEIPALFCTNAVLVITDGILARVARLRPISNASCPGGPPTALSWRPRARPSSRF